MGLQLLAPIISIGLNLVASLLQPEIRREQPDPNPQLPNTGTGAPIPKGYGTFRVETINFYPDTDKKMYEIINEEKTQGGKGGPRVTTVTKNTFGTFGRICCQGETTLEKVIINGREITPTDDFFTAYITFFDGTQTVPWSEVVNESDPPFNEIAYKWNTYLGFTMLPLTEDYGGQIPQQVSAVLIDADYGAKPSLDLVIGDICSRAGIAPGDIDVTDLATLTLEEGFLLYEDGQGYRQALEGLMQFYLFTAFESRDGKIVFKRLYPDSFTPIVVNPIDLLPIEEEGLGEKLYIKTVNASQELPNFITIEFQNVDDSYQKDKIDEPFGQFTKQNDVFLNIKLATYPSLVRRQALLILKYLFITQRNTYKFRFPATIFEDSPTFDLLEILVLPNGEEVQVHQININPDFTVDVLCKQYSPIDNFNFDPIVPNPKQGPKVFQPVDVDVYVVEAPYLPPYPPNVLYLFATGPCIIEIATNPAFEGSTQVDHESTSMIFDCLTDLPIIQGEGFTDDFLDVRKESGGDPAPANNPSTAYNARTNLSTAAVDKGNGVYEGEMIQYLDATSIGGDDFKVGTLVGSDGMIRGRFNTAGESVSNLISGGKLFVFFDENKSAYFSTIRANAFDFVNQSIYIRAITADYQDLGSTPVTTVTPQGTAYKPTAPYNIESSLDNDDNIAITWDYDSTNAEFNNATGEEQVTFEIDVFQTRPTVVNTYTTPNTSFLYKIGDRNTDGVALPFEIDIYAISTVVGRGRAGSATVNPPPIDPDDNITFTETDLSLTRVRYVTGTTSIPSPVTIDILPADDRGLIIVTTPVDAFTFLNFPDTLPSGLQVDVLNSPDSSQNARVFFQCTDFLGTVYNQDILRDCTVTVSYVGAGRCNVLGNNLNYTFINDILQQVTKSFNYTSSDSSVTITPSIPQSDLLELDFSATGISAGGADTSVDGELTDTLALLYTPATLVGIKSLRFFNYSLVDEVVQVSSKVGITSLVFDVFSLRPNEEIEIEFDPPWEYAAGDGIEAFCLNNSAVTFFMGKIDYSSSMYLFSQGTLTAAIAPIYTVAASQTAKIKVIKYYNQSVSAQTVSSRVDKASNREISSISLVEGDSFELSFGSFYEFLETESLSAGADVASVVNYFIAGVLQS